MCEDRSFESILKNAGVHTINLELEILRHYEELREKILTPYNELQAENEELKEVIEQVRRWAKAYPISAFPEPDFVKVRKALAEHSISLDAVSASNMRHVIKGVSEILEQALKGDE